MLLKRLELTGFKSFARKTTLEFSAPVTAIVGPNGSGKSNIAEAFRFVLGEQSFKSMRGKRGEDMIFGGSQHVKRANRASVSLVFDNTRKTFTDVDFEEVVIERSVFRDGENQYTINGSKVRLKDIIELLSSVHVGASAHHIISQGEADRILNARPLERKGMIEDALGLKIYQYKKRESEKKLARTEENLKEVTAIRRELAPRIKFLKEQVAKIERARSLREELIEKYQEYLKREYVYITLQRSWAQSELEEPERRLEELGREIQVYREELTREEAAQKKNSRIMELEEELRAVREQKDARVREMGRLEGEISSRSHLLQHEREKRATQDETLTIPFQDASALLDEIEVHTEHARLSEDVGFIRSALERVRDRIGSFVARYREGAEEDTEKRTRLEHELARLEEQKAQKEREIEDLSGQERGYLEENKRLQEEMSDDRGASRAAERKMFECMNAQNELRHEAERIRERLRELERADDSFKRELQEAAHVAGSFILSYKDHTVFVDDRELSEEEIAHEDRALQEDRRQDIERLKIRLDELGVGSHDEVMKEYEDVTERDEFLARECVDLERSMESLGEIIDDLEETIQSEYERGVRQINEVFRSFFSEMFGGGTASLRRVRIERSGEMDDEVEVVDGLDIVVSLPRKNIRGLMMLSGGERALTSIALIFAVSQVNPPPFLILDETDAALDEANSQKYGALLESLADHSQLLVITHNRETMARAGMLYGVTMGSDATSRLLSVKLGEKTFEKTAP